eukprot:932100-Pleurochrysis_carterae.AAC.1
MRHIHGRGQGGIFPNKRRRCGTSNIERIKSVAFGQRSSANAFVLASLSAFPASLSNVARLPSLHAVLQLHERC